MKQPESYWLFKAPPTPELCDLPAGTFSGDERAWESLSPGYRRTIWQEAVKRRDRQQSAVAADVDRLARADAKHLQSQSQIAAREAL
jgi:predicted Fe-S protein YdhL (DUF1289 family)